MSEPGRLLLLLAIFRSVCKEFQLKVELLLPWNFYSFLTFFGIKMNLEIFGCFCKCSFPSSEMKNPFLTEEFPRAGLC